MEIRFKAERRIEHPRDGLTFRRGKTMKTVTKEHWLRDLERDAQSKRLWDALSGLVDWCQEGCPEGGAYALTEARAALSNIRLA